MGYYYLGIDQGTTGTTALVLDRKWKVLGRGYKKHTQIYPRPGWVEHDPEEIFKALLEVCKEAVQNAGISFKELAGLGLDHQGETCTMWNARTGETVYHAIVWQDKRTADLCNNLAREHGGEIEETTGLYADAYFSAPNSTGYLTMWRGSGKCIAGGSCVQEHWRPIFSGGFQEEEYSLRIQAVRAVPY